ncbi:MAG: hypothetical protein IT162_00705 [Bryobacterales bacterium]|nr:hypothetical protein [Bryobacterales bacterium]
MTQIAVKFTLKELELLATLASDQLFRREFIDPKMPGQRINAAEVALGKTLVARLRALQDQAAGRRTAPAAAASRKQQLHAV